ncbi:MAG: response regulator [Imperialibacter sp.]|uniref:ATP-binding response regulator n=1 Tax=Imperialibacter sp. TaxID=2038411 RepID=UPI0032EE03B9
MKLILVIEDDLGVRENTVDILELEGYQVIAAVNGKEGVALAEQNTPDLILCDVSMPYLDGFGVFMQLAKNLKTAGTPFIFVTGQAHTTDQMNGIQLGADDYIIKPYDVDVLLATIKSRIEKHEKNKEEMGRELSAYVHELETLLYMTSHRVRSPMARCLGLIGLLENEYVNGTLNDEMKATLTYLKESVRSLDEFTRDLTQFMSESHGTRSTKLEAYRNLFDQKHEELE